MVNENAKPIVIGLLGGVACGKSFVAELLAKRGAVILDADRAGHEVLREPEIKAACRARWGDDIFSPDGQVDRKALAKIVFAPGEAGARELSHLESLTHPRIRQSLLDQLAALSTANPPTVAVLDAPVMLKSGWNKLCTHILYIDAPHAVRLTRAQSRGWTEADFNRREAAQEPLEIKRQFADQIIDNAGSASATEQQIDKLWKTLHP